MAKNNVIKGVTKSGFSYQLSKDRLNNYELLEAIGEVEESPLALSKALNLMLGKKQAQQLKDHVRNAEDIVPMDKMEAEMTEMFTSISQVKN
ncbi:hypothetical protein ACQKTA_04160 [Enterococcus sp. 22-H-5-01]|uniref:hypothetical protein n=1 Tax=Enterococcus sp. 22-H-5-01 TaxID=3418555 RepID=UPI003D06EBFB